MLSSEEFMALHRHWIWADIIKKHFEAAAKNSTTANPDELFLEPYGAYMSIWYGLYGVIEVLSERGICIPKIQSDIDNIRENLRRYRNAVFHPQPKY